MVERIDLRQRKWQFLIGSIILDVISGASFGLPLIGEVRSSCHAACHLPRASLPASYELLSFCKNLNSFAAFRPHLGARLFLPSHADVLQQVGLHPLAPVCKKRYMYKQLMARSIFVNISILTVEC